MFSQLSDLKEKCFIVLVVFFIFRIFYLVLGSIVYPLQIFQAAEKSGRRQIRGLYGTGGFTVYYMKHFKFSTIILILISKFKKYHEITFFV